MLSWPHGAPTAPKPPAATDALLCPTAYIRDQNTPPRMYEVIDTIDGLILLEDCATMHRHRYQSHEIRSRFTLVRPAVSIPNFPEIAA